MDEAVSPEVPGTLAAWRAVRPLYKGALLLATIFSSGIASATWVAKHAGVPAANAAAIVTINAVNARQDSDITLIRLQTDTTRNAVHQLTSLLIQDICLRKAQRQNASYEDCLQTGAR